MEKGEFKIEIGPTDKKMMEKVENKSYRISVGLNEKSNNVIDFFMNEIGLYNGKSDFVNAAIKEYYVEISQWSTSKLEELRKQYPSHPAKVLKKYGEMIRVHQKEYNDEFDKNYGSRYNDQYSFYVSLSVETRIKELEAVTSESKGSIIRAAIMFFIEICGEKRRVINRFEDIYGKIYEEAYGDND
ncbi:hypothetical protein [Candidatus Methanarcanum hacksteinii]|uniref:hypothetical protein n=1 Tax=Candidatus Methanarcanum hacksteinii TaxID=2911857 RepID=UPI0037DDB643